MKPIGKRIESLVRRMRPYLKSSYRRTFDSLMARGMSQRLPGEPIVCCDFSDPAIDAVGGRYYFSLILDLIDAGYFPVFTAHRQTLSNFKQSRTKSLLLDKRLGTVNSPADIKEPFLLITDSNSAFPNAARTLRVSYERRLPRAADEIAFPVFVHPQIAIKGRLPVSYGVTATRPARIFFGGNTDDDKYDKAEIGEIYGMLTRRKMLELVCAEVAPVKPADAVAWLDSPAPAPFVLCETQVSKIPPDRWLEALSKGDFFLACPGVGMPLCHNLIESMAAGAIPILQYAKYLSPELADGKECLAFHDAASLRAVVHRALEMSREEIAALRENVRARYDRDFAPGCFARKLFSGPAVLLINAYRVPR